MSAERIEALIAVVDGVLQTEAPSPEVLAIVERFEKLDRRQRWRCMLLMKLDELVDSGRQNVIADATFQQNVDDARRWSREMGRVARRLRP